MCSLNLIKDPHSRHKKNRLFLPELWTDLHITQIQSASACQCRYGTEKKQHGPGRRPFSPLFVAYLRVSFEVSLVKRLEVALVRACGRGLASWWDRVGEVGGAEYTGGPRSLSCPPWKVLRIVEPRVKRHLSEEEDEAAPAPEMLSVDGDAAGMRWPRELRSRQRKDQKTHRLCFASRKRKCDLEIFTYACDLKLYVAKLSGRETTGDFCDFEMTSRSVKLRGAQIMLLIEGIC